ncbi:PREDICTED: uncharacterized protein LOC102024830 [Chinchilla lanigera]|uniref:uncharacterized protein LOC102024830 n=1 Tax=Chinchilla lanigera TaxID=34839 RepID=UPI00038EE4F1|nr:PREDICTED: uncharacterized protein LOC102024830 [Chinchilla lanigera]
MGRQIASAGGAVCAGPPSAPPVPCVRGGTRGRGHAANHYAVCVQLCQASVRPEAPVCTLVASLGAECPATAAERAPCTQVPHAGAGPAGRSEREEWVCTPSVAGGHAECLDVPAGGAVPERKAERVFGARRSPSTVCASRAADLRGCARPYPLPGRAPRVSLGCARPHGGTALGQLSAQGKLGAQQAAGVDPASWGRDRSVCAGVMDAKQLGGLHRVPGAFAMGECTGMEPRGVARGVWGRPGFLAQGLSAALQSWASRPKPRRPGP